MFRVFRFGYNNVYVAVKVLPRSHADDLTSSEFAPRFYCWRTRGLRINRTRHSRTRIRTHASLVRRIIYVTTRKQILIPNKKEWFKNVPFWGRVTFCIKMRYEKRYPCDVEGRAIKFIVKTCHDKQNIKYATQACHLRPCEKSIHTCIKWKRD